MKPGPGRPPSAQHIGAIALLVRDYDEALDFYTEKLGFDIVSDGDTAPGKRWVLVAPQDSSGTCLLLAKAKNARELAAVGNQSGGRVFLFLHTDDFARDHREFSERGVRFVEPPRHEEYGTVAVFEDLYGNRWDLIQPRDRFGEAEDPEKSPKAPRS